MKISQPMLFVGLGGTGCRVGAELERRMREELCGPDGTQLTKAKEGSGYLPYQLPSCLQFVYADLADEELKDVRAGVVPGGEHDAAARKTMRLMTNLIPPGLTNSADVSQELSLALGDDVIGWLPPKETDPNVGPLYRGAGQLPTVGRAVLFETMRRSETTAVQALADALTDINQSAGDLAMVSGGTANNVNKIHVFVVFSVAGGTGSGIFYDYLHLVADVLKNHNVTLFPLVLMPSAFDLGQGGGRAAELNAGSSLTDLFRLIDDQNAKAAPASFSNTGFDGAMTVRYPRKQISLPASTIQTAFLFGRPLGGVDKQTLGRSMVALMLSIIGAGPGSSGSSTGGGKPMSFEDVFINGTANRYEPSATGIGLRGVSASSVAELTTPIQELTDLTTMRMLAKAIEQLRAPKPGMEKNEDTIKKVMQAAGLDRLLVAAPPPLPIDKETPPSGYDAIVKALNERGRAMARNIELLSDQLREPVARMAQDFDPKAGVEAALRNGIDLFRLERILFGHPELSGRDRSGLAGAIEALRYPPPAGGPGYDAASPPQPAGLPKKKLMSKLRWPDPAVQNVLATQNRWYTWRARQIWNAAWGDRYRVWDRTWREFREEFDQIIAPFVEFAADAEQQFEARAEDLYRPRVGVAYLLPPRDSGMKGFYRVVRSHMIENYRANPAFTESLGANPREGDIVSLLMSSKAWEDAYQVGRDKGPEATFAAVRQATKVAVANVLRPDDSRRAVALVPRMEDLLARAARRDDKDKDLERRASDEDVQQFTQKLAALVPGGYEPEGKETLQILFTYPGAEDPETEKFLRSFVSLPSDGLEPRFTSIRADSMTVTLTRTSMGLTDVPEVRTVVKRWADAQQNPGRGDFLPWRRRLVPDSAYLLMTPGDRALVLHRLLCAAWDGKVEVVGDPESPSQVVVRMGARNDAATLTLNLRSLGSLSSWASILTAYESFILVDDEVARQRLSDSLMRYRPKNVETHPDQHAEIYGTLVGLVDREKAKIEEAERDEYLRGDPMLAVVKEFWHSIVPAALDRPLIINQNKTLRMLPGLMERVGGLGAARPAEPARPSVPAAAPAVPAAEPAQNGRPVHERPAEPDTFGSAR